MAVSAGIRSATGARSLPLGEPDVNDESLNPLPIEPSSGSPRRAFLDANGNTALLWTLAIALAPIICDATLTAVIGGRPFYSVGLFHIGLALFGITLAATVRILSHGRGQAVLPFLLLAAILEVVIALYFGGTFSKSEVNRNNIAVDVHVLSRRLEQPSSQALPRAGTLQIQADLRAARDSHPEPAAADYVVMGILGLLSLGALIRFWGPPTPEELQKERRSDDR